MKGGRGIGFWLRRVLLLAVLLVVLVQLYFFVCIVWWINFNPDTTSFHAATTGGIATKKIPMQN